MSESFRNCVVLMAAGLALVLVGCKTQESGPVTRPEPTPQLVDLGEVSYDHLRPSNVPLAKVQVLVDSSASMAGFASFEPIFHAIDQGLSYSRDLYFRIHEQRLCSFNESEGIYACQQNLEASRLPKARGYTNLDRAVASSSDFNLSIIITDGVPSGADSGLNRCQGSGVDAGCVADALVGALRAAPGTPKDRIRGVWIVPLIVGYRGLYFAEQKIIPATFDPSRAEESARDTFGTNVSVEHARTGTDGTLIFDYEGPRYLLAIVVADLDVGRAFLQEFYARRAFSNMTELDHPNTYASKGASGPALLPAVEVFPSTLPEQSYGACSQERDARNRIIGGLVNCSISESNHLRLSCGESAETILGLRRNHAAQPMREFLAAPVRFQSMGGTILKGLEVGHQSSGAPAIHLRVSCDGRKPIACGTSESTSTLSTRPDFQAAANAMVTGSTVGASYLNSMSTGTPALEPEKVYGLRDLLQNFYRRQLPEGTAKFATLEICQE